MKKLIMCDLDNTLLPINTQEKFAEMWFRDIGRLLYKRGIDPSAALNAMNDGCKAMLFNKGIKTNIDVFFDVVCSCTGLSREQIEPIIDEYYATTYENVKDITLDNPYAPQIARLIREKSEYAVIATMPLFPKDACSKRMRWTGVNAEMFDLVTTCDYSSYSKPNTKYFLQILEDFNVRPEDALMIGNDVREDMEPCEKLGIEAFLVTDYLLDHGLSYSRFRQGDYQELIKYLESL